MHRLATRMADIGTEGAFTAAARARELEALGRSIIHLEIGEPDADTPIHVREAAKRALDAGATHYAPYPGVAELRQAVAEDVALRKGFSPAPEDVFVTVGGKGVMLNAVLGLVDPGDEVLVPDPGYPIYASLVRFVGATPVSVPIRQEHEFRIDVDELEGLVSDRTRMLVINSPANPTGGVLSRDDLERLAGLCTERDLLVLSDEIYGRLTYDGAEHVCIAAFQGMSERTVVLDGLSKTYAMTGWRLGYAVVPTWFRQGFGRLIINTVSCAPTFPQLGAIAALRGPQSDVEAMVAELKVRRDLLVEGLNTLRGVSCRMPLGAFYAFPDIRGTAMTDERFAEVMLDRAGVCLLPGSGFGVHGAGHVRLSYASSQDDLREALSRMRAVLEGD